MIGILLKAKGYLFAGTAVIAAVLAALALGFTKGNKSGKDGVIASQAKAEDHDIQVTHDVAVAQQAKTDDEVTKDLEKWEH